MHEMSLCREIAELVQDTARREGFRRVRAVRLEIGKLAAVEPEAIRFCFDVATRGGPADGARLEILPIEGRGWCLACSRSIDLDDPLGTCPVCGGGQIQVTGGTQINVKDLEVE